MEDFWFIVAERSGKETEIQAGQGTGKTGPEAYLAIEPSALSGGSQDPHLPERTTEQGEPLIALPPRGNMRAACVLVHAIVHGGQRQQTSALVGILAYLGKPTQVGR